MRFEIKKRDAGGRICKFSTKHGSVITPNLMPVINPNKMIITPKEMKEQFETEIVITNSYIIKKNSELRDFALKNGVHKLIDFDGPIMTDSGTFQSYVYGKEDVDPLDIIKFQRDIGSDIGTILDVFSIPDEKKKTSEQGIRKTIERAKKSMEIKKDMLLACTIQGSVFNDLRKKCALELNKINPDFIAIGGVVPLMEKQRYYDLVNVIFYSKMGLDPSKPVHLFGAGHPIIFPLAVALGCDFFDSSAYIKYAMDKRLIFPWGTEKLDALSELPCSCPVCQSYSVSDLKKLDNKKQVLEIARHNLFISFSEIKKIRTAISQGNLWELVERRARCNPYLLEALNILKNVEIKKWLEKFEPISKKNAMFYTGSNTIHRPIIYRLHKRLLDRYESSSNSYIVFPENEKPYSFCYSDEIDNIFKNNLDVDAIIDSSLGPAPVALDEMYPIAQSVFPEFIDFETERFITKVFEGFTKNSVVIPWDGDKTFEKIKQKKSKKTSFDLLRISTVCDMQFCEGASKALLSGDVRIVKSKKTGKIRNVYVDDEHVLSMRAHDGLFTLKISGGKRLHKFFEKPVLRVVVDYDAVSFVKDGKSVFAKFVFECDSNLRPLDECLIVDKKDNLLAVGRCLLNRAEMLSFNDGVAVKNRESV